MKTSSKLYAYSLDFIDSLFWSSLVPSTNALNFKKKSIFLNINKSWSKLQDLWGQSSKIKSSLAWNFTSKPVAVGKRFSWRKTRVKSLSLTLLWWLTLGLTKGLVVIRLTKTKSWRILNNSWKKATKIPK